MRKAHPDGSACAVQDKGSHDPRCGLCGRCEACQEWKTRDLALSTHGRCYSCVAAEIEAARSSGQCERCASELEPFRSVDDEPRDLVCPACLAAGRKTMLIPINGKRARARREDPDE